MDDLGDRLKAYEGRETDRRFLPGVPIYARLDGRGFSRFTRDMERPFDTRLMNAMRETAEYLVEESHATVSYSQSDEISLGWLPTDHKSGVWFDGKVHKLTSVLSGAATVALIRGLKKHFSNWETLLERMPHFDCRVFQVPSEVELMNCFLWRQLDASKNSVSMAAHHYYSHKELQHKSSSEKHDMLMARGVNWNDYPPQFKRGIFSRRATVERRFDPQEWAAIPLAHRPPLDQLLLRSEVRSFDLPPLNRVNNRVQALFHGAEPQPME